MKKKFIILITFLSVSAWLFAQQCPNGQRWNTSTKKCEKIDVPKNMEIVNYKCPNGSSFVSFKNKCLENKRVKEIYDSLRVEYLKSPKLDKRKEEEEYIAKVETDKKEEKASFFSLSFLNRKKNEEVEVVTKTAPEQEKELEEAVKNQEYLTISAEDFKMLRNEVMSLKSDVLEIKETNEQIQKDLVTFQTVLDESENTNSGEEVIASISSDEVNYLKNEIESFKNQIAEMQKVVNTLQSQPANTVASNNSVYKLDLGKNTASVAKQDIYGKNEVKFKISCPNGFKWVNEESICLRSEVFLERSLALAQNGGVTDIEYGIKDVKCPKFFLWNSKSRSCIPTMHAAVNE